MKQREPFSACRCGGEFRRGWLGVSSLAHVLGLLLVAGIPLIVARQEVISPSKFLVTFEAEKTLEPEIEPPPRPAPRPRTPPPRPRIQEPRAKIEVPEPPEPVLPPRPEPKVVPPPRPDPKPVRVPVKAGFDQPRTPAPEPAPRREVRTEVFSEPSSMTAQVVPAKTVQTGGFGNPAGLAPGRSSVVPRPMSLEKLGSFDLPAGPGQGNGSAGAAGVRGAVKSAGFGTAIDASPETNARSGTARSAGFGEAVVASEAPKARARATDPEGSLVPVEIVSKPKPSYTDEARLQRLEGEVVLEVLFRSSGRTEVLRVVRGLGHGLDESAVRAAQQILFKPARRAGQAVDSTAVVRIVFQLA